jgi:serine/threonine protein kinase
MAPNRDWAVVIDHTVDIYALGVMLFQMTTGQMPTK